MTIEQKIVQMFSNHRLAIMIVSATDGSISFCNKKASSLFGMSTINDNITSIFKEKLLSEEEINKRMIAEGFLVFDDILATTATGEQELVNVELTFLDETQEEVVVILITKHKKQTLPNQQN